MAGENEKYFKRVNFIILDVGVLSESMELNAVSPAFDLAYELLLCLEEPIKLGANYSLQTKLLINAKKLQVLCERNADLKVVENVWQEINNLRNTSSNLEYTDEDDGFYTHMCLIKYYFHNNLRGRALTTKEDLYLFLEKYKTEHPGLIESMTELVENFFKEPWGLEEKSKAKPAPKISTVVDFLYKVVWSASLIRSEKLVSALDKARQLMFLLELPEDWKLEVRRQVAEIKLKLLIERDVDFVLINQLHNEVLEWGFRDLERESSIEAFFAKYCIRQNKYDPARSTLQKLHSRLDEALAGESKPEYTELKSQVEKLLSEIPKNG